MADGRASPASSESEVTASSLLLVGTGETLQRVQRVLEGNGLPARHSADPEEALRIALAGETPIVIVSHQVADDGGLEFCRRLRRRLSLARLPIVFLLEQSDDASRRACIDAGADDYLSPNLEDDEIRARVTLNLLRTERTMLVNPLTGLPGNQEIHRILESQIAQTQPFAACYVDLDNFKAFNDHYGFELGDQVILFVAQLLNRVVADGSADDESFLGHIGGDDFLVLIKPERVESISTRIISDFDAEIGRFYHPEDRERGYLLSWDRAGNIQETPIMSLSIAVATNSHREIRHIGEVGAILADLKQYVKLLPGSNYVVDRRTDAPGGAPDREVMRDEAWKGLMVSGPATERSAVGADRLLSVTDVLLQVGVLIQQTDRLGTICFTVNALSTSGDSPVWTGVPDVIERMGWILMSQRGRAFRDEDFIVTSPAHDNALFLFLAPPRRTQTWRLAELEALAERVRTALFAEMVLELGRFETQRYQLQCGASLVRRKGGPLGRLIHQGMDAALRSAARRSTRDRGQRAAKLRQLLDAGELRAVLQPIVPIAGGTPFGYEALLRGPKGSELESPSQLLLVARSADLMWTLDRLSHRIAASFAARFPQEARLFLNCDPELAHDPEFRRVKAADYATLAGRQVVLEIPEEALARRLGLVRAALATFRSQGFEVALDHTSTEYRVLGPLAELRPEVVKFDVSLSRGIDQSPTRQALMAAMVSYARDLGAITVASGVETERERETLERLGVELCQGNLFAPGLELE